MSNNGHTYGSVIALATELLNLILLGWGSHVVQSPGIEQ